jgi:hypothetical protein
MHDVVSRALRHVSHAEVSILARVSTSRAKLTREEQAGRGSVTQLCRINDAGSAQLPRIDAGDVR